MNDRIKKDSSRTVLITGGLGGIGLACARRFVEQGDRAFVTTRSAERADKFNAQGMANGEDSIEAVVAELDTLDSIEPLLKRVGAVDVLVNNAGCNRPKPFIDLSLADFDDVMSVNLRSVFMLTQAVVRRMLGESCCGMIVTVSSQAGFVGLPERAAYCASKHAVEGLTKAIAVDLKGSGIRINNVAPTFIETEMTRETLARDDFRDLIDQRLLLQELPQPTNVAEAVCFLASERSRGITGTTIRVDGGWTAH
ncbi:MAG: SDR family oxidoreductase [Salinisphaera sp.]|jgi:NAD(P)-dependent dehydrogenase (short-subunit alcohol dehydrogenase family)|nr:SDR family oxidoreductase [Salinisphaera sp.]